MTNKKRLKAAMALAGETQASLAAKLGMFPTSLNYRINGRLDFKVSEVLKASEILGLSQDEMVQIFFGTNVD